LETCGAEVQKGNAPEERKLQRLFRNPEATTLIRRCNDFGAGGVSVAIGELADGLKIDLNAVPKKYEGLDGTELAISESQERMAVVVRASDVDKFIALAAKENLLATKVATVTDNNRLEMTWNGNVIVDLSRDFLNSNGATKHTNIKISKATLHKVNDKQNTAKSWIEHLSDLNTCSQKGLVERFDSTIGAGTVTMPFGGKTQMTPTQAMVAKIPVLKGQTTTCSVMGWGFNPYISEQSPYHGAMYAVIESVAKVVAAGGNSEHAWLTFQEYFERTNNNPTRWGKPAAALLGAFKAQIELGLGAIGGKDSMSGSFENLDVPPTLVSFAVSTTTSKKALSPEFKKAGNKVALITPKYDENGLPCFDSVKDVFVKVRDAIASGKVVSAWALSYGGVSEAIAKMSMGNKLGFKFTSDVDNDVMFNAVYGGFVLEVADENGTAMAGALVLRTENAKVKNQIRAEFAWTPYHEVNLYNEADLPAKPFIMSIR
ncbi:MAG: phosphoribosylformylglycinamidine synthase, partial [Oscillospiraceae bacterium]|nr:phosphoribosylformylglycinamidine synthase [Oscillospiraceae bacterium]